MPYLTIQFHTYVDPEVELFQSDLTVSRFPHPVFFAWMWPFLITERFALHNILIFTPCCPSVSSTFFHIWCCFWTTIPPFSVPVSSLPPCRFSQLCLVLNVFVPHFPFKTEASEPGLSLQALLESCGLFPSGAPPQWSHCASCLLA